MSWFKQAVDRERRIDDLMRGAYQEWRVEKQVIVVPPTSESKELVMRNSVQIVDFTWPRIIRVTISNGRQVHLIGDTGMRAEHESSFNALVNEAEERCVFLNSNKVG